jgi:hypothetical protein
MPEFVLQDTPDFETIPDGEILTAEVVNVEERDSFYEDERNPGQKKKQISFRFAITEPGEHAGRVVFGNTPTTFTNHADCKLRIWVQELLGEDELPVGFKFNTDALIGLPCRLAIGARERLGADGKTKVSKNFVADVIRANPARLANEVF